MLGDGIRRNIATVSKEERDRFRDAIIKLQTLPQFHYPGNRTDTPVGGVSYWFKQDEIHAGSHVHVCPAFLPWHRELINRFEALLQLADPQLSLHYWDWTTDPGWMFAPDFMGNGNAAVDPTVPPETSGGQAGDPWLTAGLYNPTANPFRTDNEFSTTDNPFDPPHDIARGVQPGAPVTPAQEALLLAATSFAEFDTIMERSTTNDQVNNFDGGLHGAAMGGLAGSWAISIRLSAIPLSICYTAMSTGFSLCGSASPGSLHALIQHISMTSLRANGWTPTPSRRRTQSMVQAP